MEFAKERNDQYIEGYLSDKKSFNRVLFLLREPNAPDRQDSFWFKDQLESPREKQSAAFKKYCGKMQLFLSYLKDDSLKLDNCAYANMIPDRGESRCSEAYKNLKPEYKYKRFVSLCKIYNPRFIFTCGDIFTAIKKQSSIELALGKGIKYKNKSKEKTLRKMTIDADREAITIYEIYHPSYWEMSPVEY